MGRGECRTLDLEPLGSSPASDHFHTGGLIFFIRFQVGIMPLFSLGL